MAEIKFRCPACAQRIALDESAAGLEIDCPDCRSTLRAPGTSLAPVEIVVKRQRPPRKFHCPQCRQRLSVEDTGTGVEVECPRCHSPLKLPASSSGEVEMRTMPRLFPEQKAAPEPKVAEEPSDGWEVQFNLSSKNKARAPSIPPKESLEMELSQLLSDATATRAELGRMKSSSERAKLEVNDLRKHLEGLGTELDQTHHDFANAERERARLADELGLMRRHLGVALAANADLVKAGDAFKALADASREAHRAAEEKLRAERDALAAKIIELETTNKEGALSRADTSKLQQQLTEAIQERASWQAAAAVETAKAKQALREVEELTSQLSSRAMQLAEAGSLQPELHQLRQQLADLSRERDALRAKLEQSSNEARKAQEAIAGDLTGARQTAKAQTEEVQRLRQQCDSLSTKLAELDQLRRTQKALAEENAQLKDRLARAEQERSDLQSRFQTATADARSAREQFAAEVAQTREAAKAQTEEAQRLKQQCDSFSTKLAELDQLRRTQAAVAEENGQLKERLARAEQERSDLQSRFEAAAADARSAREQLPPIAKASRKLEEQLREAGERIALMERERAEFQKRLDDPARQAQLTDLSQKLETATAEGARARSALDGIAKELAAARAELTRQDDVLRLSSERIFERERELATARLKTEELQQRIDDLEHEAAMRRPAGLGTRTTDVPQRPVTFEERRRQIESDLALAGERIRSIKAKRFLLRERLAAKEAELQGPSEENRKAGLPPDALRELQRTLEELQPAAERAREDYELLKAQLRAVEAAVGEPHGTAPEQLSEHRPS